MLNITLLCVDCTEPFTVFIFTDATNTLAGTAIADTNRGISFVTTEWYFDVLSCILF